YLLLQLDLGLITISCMPTKMAQKEFKHEVKENQHPKCLSNLRLYFMEYCNNTSIHGFKYLGERRSPAEKIFWAIVLTISLYYCTFNIVEIYQKWKRSPVIVSFATKETPIWDVPFPAITICPRTKAIKTKFNFTEMVLLNDENFSNDKDFFAKKLQFDYMSMVCSSTLELFSDKYPTWTVDSGIITFLTNVQTEYNETVKYFSWAGQNLTNTVSDLFKPIITSAGICYTFNMLDRDEIFTDEMDKEYYNTFGITHQPKSQWSIERGYDKDADLNAFPLRTVVSGAAGGVDMILVTYDADLDYICGDALQGYKVILHHPARLPNPRQDYFRLGLNQDVAVSVKPNMMKTSKRLKNYDSANRGCYLIKEKKLRFFKTYDQLDCLFECLSNYTYKYCECVGFDMPRANSTPICGPSSKTCMSQANTKFLSSEVSFRIEHPERKFPRNISEEDFDQDCNCLPACDSLSFDADVSLTEWEWQKGSKIVSPKKESDNLKVNFKIHFVIFRIWWSVFLTISLYFCATLILKTYKKWERSPVIVSFATSETPISHIPFPAVTICPQIKAAKEKFDFSKVGILKNNGTEISSVKDKHYSYMFLVCSDKQALLVDIGKKVTTVADGGVIRYLMEVK
ncbi:hypothetical protein ILUMI_02380, partial [Ignelater luminosus]